MPNSKNRSTEVEVNVVVEYTDTAAETSLKLAYFLLERDIEPEPVLEKMVAQFEEKVKMFPLSCQISPELEKLGCTRYRQFNAKDGHRILYDVVETGSEVTVFAKAFVGRGQDVQQLLFERIIERD